MKLVLGLLLLLVGSASAISMQSGYQFSAIDGSYSNTVSNGYCEYMEQINGKGPFSISSGTQSGPDYFKKINLAITNFPLEAGSDLNALQRMRTYEDQGTITTKLSGTNSFAGLFTTIDLSNAWFTTNTGLLSAGQGAFSLDRSIFYGQRVGSSYQDGDQLITEIDAWDYSGETVVLDDIILHPSSHALETGGCKDCKKLL